MRIQRLILVLVGFALLAGASVAADAKGTSRGSTGRRSASPERVRDLPPEVEAFLGFIEDEEAELQYQLENDEITPAEYQVTKARLAITRDAVVRLARGRSEGAVPELHVLLATELTQVLAGGLEELKGKRAGEAVNESWRFHGTATRGQTFYILERTGPLGPARAE